MKMFQESRICLQTSLDGSVRKISDNDAGSSVVEHAEGHLSLLRALSRTTLKLLRLETSWTSVNQSFGVWVRRPERPNKHASVSPSFRGEYPRYLSSFRSKRRSSCCGHPAARCASSIFVFLTLALTEG